MLHKPFSIPQFERIVNSLDGEVRSKGQRCWTRGPSARSETNAIEPYFQPKIHLDCLEVVGFEALARLRLPSGEILLPNQCIDTAAESDLLNA